MYCGWHMVLWTPRPGIESLKGLFLLQKIGASALEQQLFVIDVQMTHLVWMQLNFQLAIENWGNAVLFAWLG